MMTRFVTLMNPSSRRARRRARVSRMRRNRLGRFTRRSHSNPPRRRRARRRRAAVAVYRRPVRRRRYRHSGVVHMNPPKMTPAMRRKISLAVRAANRRRSSGGSRRRTTIVHARPMRRRFSRRSGGFGGGSLISSFRGALSRPLLMKAGGAVLASVGTGFVLNRWGASLPLANHQYGRIIYTLGVPVLAAYLVRRKSRDLAEGLVIGGLVMTINTLMTGFRAALPAVATPGAVGSYAVAGELGNRSGFGFYPSSGARGALGGSNVAFHDSAW